MLNDSPTELKHIHIVADSGQEALLAIMAHLAPADVGGAIDTLIERLDKLGGDPDLEPNGDELDGNKAEDDFCDHSLAYPGPGCPVSDGGCSTGSGAGDPSWTEWQTRGRFKLGKHGEEPCRRNDLNMAHEDDEDDDPREANGDEHDTGDSEEDELSRTAEVAAHYWHSGTPGCEVSDSAEPSLGVPEACVGRWGGNLVMGGTSDGEPWRVPASLNSPSGANDQ